MTPRRAALISTAVLAALTVVLPSRSAPVSYGDGGAVYAALRHSPATRLTVGGGAIDVVFADDGTGLDRAAVLAWVNQSAVAVSTYFGRFPVAHVGVLIVPEEDDRIRTGTTFGYDGSAIRIHVGRDAKAPAFKDDWILVHEMTHLALPDLPTRNLWLQEGSATYVEPIARAQAGQLDVATVWRWTLQGLPTGQASAAGGGLDGTRDHDRIYWGGATFWLLADLRIRERTHGRLSVQTALRAINAVSGGDEVRWTPDQVMATGDAATGGTELAELYAQMKGVAYPLDVPGLFSRLGIGLRGREVTFDETAPLAAIRRQITSRPGAP